MRLAAAEYSNAVEPSKGVVVQLSLQSTPWRQPCWAVPNELITLENFERAIPEE
jgi:hypothetical protein